MTTGLATTWPDAARKLVLLEHRVPPIIQAARHSANLAVTCKAQCWFCETASGH